MIKPIAVSRIYAHSTALFQMNNAETGVISRLHIMFWVGLTILFVATANYSILAAAKWNERRKELLIRRILGAGSLNIIRNVFFEEAVLIVSTAVVATVIACEGSSFLAAYLTPISYTEAITWITFFAVILFCLFLLGMSLLSVLKNILTKSPGEIAGRRATAHKATKLRKTYVFLQAFASSILAMSVWTMISQLDHLNATNLGFEPDNVVYARLPDTMSGVEKRTLLERASRLPAVDAVGIATSIPGGSAVSSTVIVNEANGSGQISVNYIGIDVGFLPALGVNPLYGELFSDRHFADSLTADRLESPVVINAGLAKILYGAAPNALGKPIGSVAALGGKSVRIIGVIPDLSWFGPSRPAVPTLYFPEISGASFLVARSSGGTFSALNENLKSLVGRTSAGRVSARNNFELLALGATLRSLFQEQRSLVNIMGLLAVIAGLLTATGLIATTRLALIESGREIAIRRVIGGTVAQIISLIWVRSLLPVFIANLAAAPVAWMLMTRWIEAFANRVELEPVYFVVVLLGSIILGSCLVIGNIMHVVRTPPASVLQTQ